MEEGGDDILYVSFSLSLASSDVNFFFSPDDAPPKHTSCWELHAAAKLSPVFSTTVISLLFPSERRLSGDEV